MAGVDGGLYMDPEELDLLHRYAIDNPTFVSFKDTDHRRRNLEERFAECDVEKIVRRCAELLKHRRELFAADQRIQTLPINPIVPSIG